MQTRNRFQYEVATGRITLPVASLIAIIVWLITSLDNTLEDWTQVGSLLTAGFIAYVLIEMDTKFALIRTRTTMPSSLFLVFFAALPFLHGWTVDLFLPVLFLLLLSSLFKSYESPYASVPIFHAFFWLGIMSLILPTIIWLAPLMYLHMIPLRSLDARSFFAGLIGISIPYWFLLGYYVYIGNISGFLEKSCSLIQFQPIDYTMLQLDQWISWGIILLLYITFTILYSQSAFKDKVQTRIILKIIIFMGFWMHLFILLQPQYVNQLLPLAILPGTIIGGHLFALTNNKPTYIVFIITLSICGLLCLFNLWMLFFNF
ncbi:hypothetical protein [uncultured Bacteroides sp.]|uniref:hypothetical protein n=1 Tax=uncultured Bacteroides sp. TaxID=162156 RepID=UPI002602AC69|nr:hypothetical protein [uncultured Bacteroides sp.]